MNLRREEVAQAIADARYPNIAWRLLSEPTKDGYRNMADAAITAMFGAGPEPDDSGSRDA